MIRHIEVAHRTETGRTTVRHYVNNVLDRTDRSSRTLAEAMQHVADLHKRTGQEVLFTIDGIEFEVK